MIADGNEIHVGLCAGRHPIKRNDNVLVDEFVFDTPVDDVLDFAYHRQRVLDWTSSHRRTGHVYLYVTGLTPLLTAFLHIWKRVYVTRKLTLMHYDRESDTYKQERWA